MNLGSCVEVERVVTGIQNEPELVSNCLVSVIGCNTGQHLLHEIHNQLQALQCSHCHPHVHNEWVLGLLGVQGNEDTDLLSRNTASRTPVMAGSPSYLAPILCKPQLARIAALKATGCEKISPAWAHLWQASPRVV